MKFPLRLLAAIVARVQYEVLNANVVKPLLDSTEI